MCWNCWKITCLQRLPCYSSWGLWQCGTTTLRIKTIQINYFLMPSEEHPTIKQRKHTGWVQLMVKKRHIKAHTPLGQGWWWAGSSSLSPQSSGAAEPQGDLSAARTAHDTPGPHLKDKKTEHNETDYPVTFVLFHCVLTVSLSIRFFLRSHQNSTFWNLVLEWSNSYDPHKCSLYCWSWAHSELVWVCSSAPASCWWARSTCWETKASCSLILDSSLWRGWTPIKMHKQTHREMRAHTFLMFTQCDGSCY